MAHTCLYLWSPIDIQHRGVLLSLLQARRWVHYTMQPLTCEKQKGELGSYRTQRLPFLGLPVSLRREKGVGGV